MLSCDLCGSGYGDDKLFFGHATKCAGLPRDGAQRVDICFRCLARGHNATGCPAASLRKGAARTPNGIVRIDHFCWRCLCPDDICPGRAEKDASKHVDGALLRQLSMVSEANAARRFKQWLSGFAPEGAVKVPEPTRQPREWKDLERWIVWAFTGSTKLPDAEWVPNITLVAAFRSLVRSPESSGGRQRTLTELQRKAGTDTRPQ